MELLAERLHFYTYYHSHPINKILHYIGTPFVFFALLIFSSWIHLTMTHIFNIPISFILCFFLLLYYYQMDLIFTLIFSVILVPLVFFAYFLSNFWVSYLIFSFLFTVGWILQIIGHFLENKRPAFTLDLNMLFVAPLFVLSEFAFAQGYRDDLQTQIALCDDVDMTSAEHAS